jgi:hypothetical protein
MASQVFGSRILLNTGSPVVQRWVSANPGLKFNPLFWFVKKHFQIYRQAVTEFALNFKLT